MDRLSGDESATLDEERPVGYERNDLQESIDHLAQFPRANVAKAIGISERAWRSIIKGSSQPRPPMERRIRLLVARERCPANAKTGTLKLI